MSSFSISETLREAQLELMLDKPLNCCTVSVKVQFEESVTGIIAKGKLYNNVLCGKNIDNRCALVKGELS